MHPVDTFELILVLLAIVIGLSWLAQRLRLPPSAALLVGGGALAFIPGLPHVELDPELAARWSGWSWAGSGSSSCVSSTTRC